MNHKSEVVVVFDMVLGSLLAGLTLVYYIGESDIVVSFIIGMALFRVGLAIKTWNRVPRRLNMIGASFCMLVLLTLEAIKGVIQ